MAHSLLTPHRRLQTRARAGAFPVVFGVLLCGWLAGGVAHAKPDKHAAGGDPYDAAREAEARLDYKAVIANGTAALDMANTHERLVTLYSLLGTAYGVLGRNEDA